MKNPMACQRRLSSTFQALGIRSLEVVGEHSKFKSQSSRLIEFARYPVDISLRY